MCLSSSVRIQCGLGMSERERIGNVMFSLDLGFSDFFKDENVRQLTLQKKLGIIEQAVELIGLEESMNFSVFSSKGSKHPTAETYAIDFPSDLRASTYLLLGGYYRQAILSLRNWLEIRLTGVYFALVSREPSEYEDWKKGKRRAPIGQALIRSLFSRAEFHKANRLLRLHEDMKKSYKELSTFTHGGVLTRYDLQSKTDNVPRFNPQSVDLWFEFASKVFGELVMCYFLAYGRKAFVMKGDEIATLKKHLPSLYRQCLQEGGI
jgi:hypothetical protein